ncbi:MAG: HAD-IIIA family hydrolase [Lachnospiraceae bacterium]|nr:HAD-IIIA family hydrolase [Lachnospiraceae bacterium]
MKVVIMAGGKGTRIASINGEVPKPMISICDKPILEYQIECLRNQGLTDIILIVGYLGDVIKKHFGNGKEFGVYIEYIWEETPLGTAGALYFLRDVIEEDFFLINGDIIFDVDLHRLQNAHENNGGLATILTHPNSHPYDSGIIIANHYGRVVKWLTKEEERIWYKNRVNAGIHIFSPEILQRFDKLEKKDLDRDILKPLIAEGKLFIYQSPEYVKDMGTPERYYAVTEDICSGLVHRRNLQTKQKAVFLDRDGTINEYVGFLRNIEEMKLLDGASEAIKLLNQSGYLTIVVTNQPVIARGEVTCEELEEIHNKMETLLGNAGAYIDDLFYCPHHPDKGFEGERQELKVDCDCRKPKPGMLLEAAIKYNIDLSESWMIGDSENDILAGKTAGCRVAFIGEGYESEIPCYMNLLSCVQDILNKEK